jgi:hypothetical protein
MLEFKEKISVANGKYLLSLSNSQLSEIITRSDKNGWNGENIFSNIETYMKQLRKWLKTAVKQMEINGEIKAEYKFSTNLVDCGRIYVKTFGVQKLTRELRGFLIGNETIDIDMKNAHPSILYNILRTHYKNEKAQFPFIRDYVKQRQKYLTEYKCSKLDILISMNSNKIMKTDNQILKKLDKEFKSIQKLFWNTIEKKIELPKTITQRKNQMKQNKEGKFLNVILCFFENNILQKVMCNPKLKENINTPMYDGMTVSKDINKEDLINELNQLTKPDGIKWDIKEHDDSIKIDEGVDITYNSTLTYGEQKEQFEKNHFIIENPLMYGRTYEVDGEEKYQFYGKEKFRDLVKPIKFFKIEDGDGYDAEFFPEWIEDATRRSYKEIKFIPKFEENPEIFNSFKGFEFQHTITEFDEDDDEVNEVIEKFGKHLALLCNYDEKASEYLFNYIAHLIQKPYEKPSTAIILKSKQGWGKDLLIDFISKMMGESYLMRTAEMDDIFGTYNVGIRDKLLLQLNEVEGKDGFSNKEKIKNLITEEKTIIREKYISQYDQKNYLRLFILSNNLNPIEISHDDRRFCVFKAHHKKPSEQYFKELHAIKDDDRKMELLFNYIMNWDISNFNPRNDRPRTEAYNNMKEHNQNPLYKYIWDMFVNEDYKNNFSAPECRKKKNSNIIYVKSNSLFSNYKEFLNDEEKGFIKPTFKLMKTILGDIGISKKQVKISGINSDYYVIDTEELKDQLSSYNLDDEIEEFDDDDFEDFEGEEEEEDEDC